MKILTLERLERMHACHDAIKSFKEIFGTKAKIENVVKQLHNPKLYERCHLLYKRWEGWLLSQDVELTRALFDAGADVHANNDCALRWAAERGHTEAVKLLLNAGADVHANNDYALRWATENGHTETVKILKEAMKKS